MYLQTPLVEGTSQKLPYFMKTERNFKGLYSKRSKTHNSPSLIAKINILEKKDAKNLLNSIKDGQELDTKSITFLRHVTGLRAVDLANKLKISKSTISNWDKRNSTVPYHLALLLGALFVHRLHLPDIEKSFRQDLDILIAS